MNPFTEKKAILPTFEEGILADFPYVQNIDGVIIEEAHFLQAATGRLEKLLQKAKKNEILLSPRQQNHLQAISLFYKFKYHFISASTLVRSVNPILFIRIPLCASLENILYQHLNEQHFNHLVLQQMFSQKQFFEKNTTEMIDKIRRLTGFTLHEWQFFEATLGRVPALLKEFARRHFHCSTEYEEILWSIQHYGHAFSKELPLDQEYNQNALPKNALFPQYPYSSLARPSLKKLQQDYGSIVKASNIPVVSLLNADIFFCAYTGKLPLLQLSLATACSEKKDTFTSGYNSTLLLAISLAIESSKVEIVHYLISRNKDKAMDKRTQLHRFSKKWIQKIIHNNDLSMLRLFFNAFGTLLCNEDLSSAFSLAIIEENPPMVCLLFELSENVLTPLLKIKIFFWAVQQDFFYKENTQGQNPDWFMVKIATFYKKLSRENIKEELLNTLQVPNSMLPILTYSLDWAISAKDTETACSLLGKIQEYVLLRTELTNIPMFETIKEHTAWIFKYLHTDTERSFLEIPLLQQLKPGFLSEALLYSILAPLEPKTLPKEFLYPLLEPFENTHTNNITALYQKFKLFPLKNLEKRVPEFEPIEPSTSFAQQRKMR